MYVRVAEKAASGAFRASMVIIALITIAITWPSFFNIHVVPYELAEKSYPGLGLGFISVIAYLVFYAYYVKSKKIIEG